MPDDAVTAAPTGGAGGRSTQRRAPSRRRRTVVLTTHIATAVGALGADLTLLALGVTAIVRGDPVTVRTAYVAMDLLAGTVVLPLALTALVTGVIVALNTRWGIARHWWVLAKLVLTVGLATAAVFVLRPVLDRAASDALGASLAQLSETGIGAAARAAIIAPTTALVVLLATTVLSVAKPWGTTPWAGGDGGRHDGG